MNLSSIIVELIDERVIRVRLENGHEVIATLPLAVHAAGVNAGLGSKVLVSVVPFDMSKGIVVLEQ